MNTKIDRVIYNGDPKKNPEAKEPCVCVNCELYSKNEIETHALEIAEALADYGMTYAEAELILLRSLELIDNQKIVPNRDFLNRRKSDLRGKRFTSGD